MSLLKRASLSVILSAAKNLAILLVLTCSFSFSSHAAPAPAGSPVPTAPKEDKDTAVLDALNTALKDNKDLRSKLASAQDTIKKMTIEQGTVKSQIRQLTSERDSWGERLKDQRLELEKKLKEVDQAREKVRLERENVKRSSTAAEERQESVLAENAKLKQVLQGAILESERDDYQKLIKEADVANRHAEGKVSEMAQEMQRMKTELVDLHYNLGNEYFRMKEWGPAVAHFERAIELNPADAWPHYNLGILYDYYVKDGRRAAWHYRKYLELKPVKEEANNIRERLLQVELEQRIIPKQPLRSDFDRGDKRTYEYEKLS